VLGLTWRGQRQYFAGLRPAPWRRGLARLRAARAYAADYGLQALFGQVDSIVLAFYFGPAAVGVYQAGMRLFLGASQAASVLGNVAIPKLSSMRAQGLDTAKEARRVQLAFVLVGALGGLALALLPPGIVVAMFGPAYLEMTNLLPWLGALFLVRLSAAAWGLLLTVSGRQSLRACLTAAHWVVIGAVAFLVLPSTGVVGWIAALLAGNVALFITYALMLRRTTGASVQGLPLFASLASCAGLIAFAMTRP
jgi:O-antigen/teichoic acid export membrane protein